MEWSQVLLLVAAISFGSLEILSYANAIEKDSLIVLFLAICALAGLVGGVVMWWIEKIPKK